LQDLEKLYNDCKEWLDKQNKIENMASLSEVESVIIAGQSFA
jgi:hypothetical protein